jgi:hypothetical protein
MLIHISDVEIKPSFPAPSGYEGIFHDLAGPDSFWYCLKYHGCCLAHLDI